MSVQIAMEVVHRNATILLVAFTAVVTKDTRLHPMPDPVLVSKVNQIEFKVELFFCVCVL